jgi:hypothetical protein
VGTYYWAFITLAKNNTKCRRKSEWNYAVLHEIEFKIDLNPIILIIVLSENSQNTHFKVKTKTQQTGYEEKQLYVGYRTHMLTRSQADVSQEDRKRKQ